MKRILFQILLVACIFIASPANTYAQSKIQRGTNTKKTTTETVKKAGDESKKQNSSSTKSTASTKLTTKKDTGKFNFDIIDVSFANTDINGKIIDPYDSKLYAKEIMYLKPRITYKSNNPNSQNATLFVKIFDEAGNLKQGTGSPEGFAYSDQFQPLTTTSHQYLMSGWGNTGRSAYSPGVYRYEFWINGKNIYEKSVRLYSGAPPIVDNSFFKINSATVCSTNENSIVEISNSEDFYSQDVKYLTTRLNYTGLSKADQTIPVYIRIFNSNGVLMGGDQSPEGFTYKTDITIYPGTNTLLFTGWGNTAGGAYKPGDVRIEYWVDGEKIHEGHVTIKDDKEKSKSIKNNGHEWVDLGLPSGKKWASVNIGASKPSDIGSYYNWGKTYTFRKKDASNDIQYNIAGNKSYDVAASEWGGSWRIPSWLEWKELYDNCSTEETKISGRKCIKFTGKNGKSIIVPYGGWYTSDGDLYNKDSGLYWTSDPADNSTLHATGIQVLTSPYRREDMSKWYGLLIRPVLH